MAIIRTLARSIAAAAIVITLSSALTGHGTAASTTGRQPQPTLAGDPVVGARIYQTCMGCHSLDENDVGPRHRGVVGRKAGSVPGYAYSAALKRSGIVWTPDQLDRWLSGPQALVPGAKMYFSVANPRNRADIIAYLAQQK
jgi:cytochrome c